MASLTQSEHHDAARGRELRATVVLDRLDGLLPPSDQAAATLAATRFGESVVYCPSGDDAALRYALGAGCTSVAAFLADCIADVYLLGRGGVGVEGDLMAARIAVARGAILVLDGLDIRCVNDELQVDRDLGHGVREVLTFAGPVVLLMADDAPQPKYVSRFRRRAAARPSAVRTNQVDKRIQWGPVRQRPKTADLTARTTGDARSRLFDTFGLSQDQTVSGEVLTGDAETCAAYLIRYLAHHGFIDRNVDPGLAPTTDSSPATSAGSTESQMDTATSASRWPRSLDRPAKGAARRPRPYRTTPQATGKLARGPRPAGGNRAIIRRGPYPMAPSRKSIDG